MRPVTRPCLALAFVLLVVSAAGLAHADSLGSWAPTTPYPAHLGGVACASVAEDVYCVGGFGVNLSSSDSANYAAVNGSGAGPWVAGEPYPTPVDSASCVASATAIYCVGGEDSTAVLDDVYYAQVSATGALGSWSAAASYPEPTAAASCVAYGGYVYCVGGFDTNGVEVDSAYYAALGSPGLDSWSATTQYPKAADSESCVAYSGYVYCVAGEVDVKGNENYPIDNVYYAPLSPSGIGEWSFGTAYPASLAAPSCAERSGYVYCVGGFDVNGLSHSEAYEAPLSPSGAGPWTPVTSYPAAIDTSSCVVASSDIYCVGGVSSRQSGLTNVDGVYYAPVSGSTSAAPEFPVAASIPLTLAAALGVAALLQRGRRARP